MPFRRVFLVFLCLSALLISGCERAKSPTALSLVRAVTAADAAAPAGDIYLLSDGASLRAASLESAATVPAERVRLADERLLFAVFGTEGVQIFAPDSALPVEDGALRLSTADSPCECIVLRCVNRAHTDKIAALLLNRLSLLRRERQGNEHQALLESAEVIVMDRFVLLVISHDVPAALAAARRTLS